MSVLRVANERSGRIATLRQRLERLQKVNATDEHTGAEHLRRLWQLNNVWGRRHCSALGGWWRGLDST